MKEFKKGDKVEYDNGTHKEKFIVYSADENHLYSTSYNIPSFNKKYCTLVVEKGYESYSQSIKDLAEEFASNQIVGGLGGDADRGDVEFLLETGFMNGYVTGMPKWVSVEPRNTEAVELLTKTDSRRIQCLFDNGEIRSMTEHHPFAIMTHICILPELPEK